MIRPLFRRLRVGSGADLNLHTGDRRPTHQTAGVLGCGQSHRRTLVLSSAPQAALPLGRLCWISIIDIDRSSSSTSACRSTVHWIAKVVGLLREAGGAEDERGDLCVENALGQLIGPPHCLHFVGFGAGGTAWFYSRFVSRRHHSLYKERRAPTNGRSRERVCRARPRRGRPSEAAGAGSGPPSPSSSSPCGA